MNNLMKAFDRRMRSVCPTSDTNALMDLIPARNFKTPKGWLSVVAASLGIGAIPRGMHQFELADQLAQADVLLPSPATTKKSKVKGLSREEDMALVKFWKKYMKARKGYEALQAELKKDTGYAFTYKGWLDYLEAKQEAFNELVLTIPEVRYTEFWRSVTGLRPQEAMAEIIRYRKEKEAKLEAEREQRAKEKAVLTGGKK